MKLYFNVFLAKIKITRDLDDIVKFIKKHPNLSKNEVKILLNIVREENSTFHMLEIAKYAYNLSLKDIYIIGCNIARNGTAYEAFDFLKLYNDESSLNYLLVKKICKDSNVNCMINLIINMKAISNNYHETIMSLIIEKSPLDVLFYHLKENPQEFSDNSLKLVIERLSKVLIPYYIWRFSYLFGYYETNTLASIMTLTNDPKYLYYFLKSNPNLNPEFVQAILFKLIETGSLKYMHNCLLNCTNLTSSHRLQLFDKIREIENQRIKNSKENNIKVFKYTKDKRKPEIA